MSGFPYKVAGAFYNPSRSGPRFGMASKQLVASQAFESRDILGRVQRKLFMIRFAFDDLEGAIDLLEQHDARKIVRQRERSEAHA